MKVSTETLTIGQIWDLFCTSSDADVVRAAVVACGTGAGNVLSTIPPTEDDERRAEALLVAAWNAREDAKQAAQQKLNEDNATFRAWLAVATASTIDELDALQRQLESAKLGPSDRKEAAQRCDARRRALLVGASALPPGHSICPGCRCEIDENTCHCGSASADHDQSHGHSPVPMGCMCHSLREGDGEPPL